MKRICFLVNVLLFTLSGMLVCMEEGLKKRKPVQAKTMSKQNKEAESVTNKKEEQSSCCYLFIAMWIEPIRDAAHRQMRELTKERRAEEYKRYLERLAEENQNQQIAGKLNQ